MVIDSKRKPMATGPSDPVNASAIMALMAEQDVYAYAFEGTRYDAGTTMGWLKASVELALERPDIGAEFRSYLASVDLR